MAQAEKNPGGALLPSLRHGSPPRERSSEAKISTDTLQADALLTKGKGRAPATDRQRNSTAKPAITTSNSGDNCQGRDNALPPSDSLPSTAARPGHSPSARPCEHSSSPELTTLAQLLEKCEGNSELLKLVLVTKAEEDRARVEIERRKIEELRLESKKMDIEYIRYQQQHCNSVPRPAYPAVPLHQPHLSQQHQQQPLALSHSHYFGHSSPYHISANPYYHPYYQRHAHPPPALPDAAATSPTCAEHPRSSTVHQSRSYHHPDTPGGPGAYPVSQSPFAFFKQPLGEHISHPSSKLQPEAPPRSREETMSSTVISPDHAGPRYAALYYSPLHFPHVSHHRRSGGGPAPLPPVYRHSSMGRQPAHPSQQLSPSTSSTPTVSRDVAPVSGARSGPRKHVPPAVEGLSVNIRALNRSPPNRYGSSNNDGPMSAPVQGGTAASSLLKRKFNHDDVLEAIRRKVRANAMARAASAHPSSSGSTNPFVSPPSVVTPINTTVAATAPGTCATPQDPSISTALASSVGSLSANMPAAAAAKTVSVTSNADVVAANKAVSPQSYAVPSSIPSPIHEENSAESATYGGDNSPTRGRTRPARSPLPLEGTGVLSSSTSSSSSSSPTATSSPMSASADRFSMLRKQANRVSGRSSAGDSSAASSFLIGSETLPTADPQQRDALEERRPYSSNGGSAGNTSHCRRETTTSEDKPESQGTRLPSLSNLLSHTSSLAKNSGSSSGSRSSKPSAIISIANANSTSLER